MTDKIQIPKNLIVKKSRNGKGVFAATNFRPNQVVFNITGPLLACDDGDGTEEIVRDNTFRYSRDLFMSPHGTAGDYFNHSCEPNTKIVKKAGKLFIVSISDIKKGEELVFDYSTIIAADDVWTISCNCGSWSCRKLVGQFRKLPKKTRERYLALKMVPKYIQ